ncbi:hypothetical protein MASR2M47_16030 [Draconibacterium sp.]|jgi:hypothetical protein
MKKYIFLIVVIFIVNSVEAQKQYIQKNESYKSAKIYQKGKSTLLVNNLKLVNDSLLQYSLESTGTLRTLNISSSNINYVTVKNGSYAGLYGAVGGLSCLAGALLGMAQAKNDPYYDEESFGDPTGLIVGITAGGAAIGAIIGACIPKWKVLYVPEKTKSYSMGFSPYVSPNYCGLGLKISF